MGYFLSMKFVLLLNSFLMLMLPLVSTITDAETKLLARHKDVVAYLSQCEKKEAHIEVMANDGQVFIDSAGGFAKLTRSLKYILPSQCQEVEKIKILGTVDGKLWYAGATTVNDNWNITFLFAPPN